jgi:hypothetical protein
VHIIFESDQLPSCLVVVAAVFRIGQKARDGVEANQFKEVGLLDCSQQMNLLFDSER